MSRKKEVSLFFTKPVLNKSYMLFQLGLRKILENNSYSPFKEKETVKSRVLLKSEHLQEMYLKSNSVFVIFVPPTHPSKETSKM